MKKLLALLILLSFNLVKSAQHDYDQKEDLKKRFFGGVGQGIIAVPLTPCLIMVGGGSCILATYEYLDNYAKNRNSAPLPSLSREDKTQRAGQITGYLACSSLVTLLKLFRK